MGVLHRTATAIAIWLTVLSFASTLGAPPSVESAQGVQLTRGPFLQNATTDSALVCLETNPAAVATVVYGTTSEYGSVARGERAEKAQCVRLPGLLSYTRYHYKVLVDGAELAPGATFRTLAGPEQKSIRFTAWGDNRTNFSIHRQLAGVVKSAAPDFVINVGDFVESGRRQRDWNLFFEAQRELLANAPFYPALGNHEENSPLYFSLLSLPGNERWYSFDSGPVHFIALDVVFSDYQPGSEQYAWLERDLRDTTLPWKIAYMHFPPYSFSSFRSGGEGLRKGLSPLFEKYGVQLVFSGHDHYYQRNQVDGVTYIVAGGGGAPLHAVRKGPSTLHAEETYHFVKVSVEDRVLTSTGVRLDGTEFDSFSLILPKVEREEGSATSQRMPREAEPIPEGAVTVPPSEPAASAAHSPGLVETLSCRRCHKPFRLANRQLLVYGWDYHRSFAIGGVLASVVGGAGLATVWSQRPGSRRKNRKGFKNVAQSKINP